MDAATVFWEEDVDLVVEREDIPVQIRMTESGSIKMDVLDGAQFDRIANLASYYQEVSGTGANGETVALSHVRMNFGVHSSQDEGSYQFLNNISMPRGVTIDGTDGYVSRHEPVTIRFDVLCLKHFIPHQVEQEITLLERSDWSVTASALDGIEDRVEYIKTQKIPIRTVHLRVTQNIPGDVAHQMNQAEEKMRKLLPLAGFVQGTGPSYVRAELETVDGRPAESVDGGLRFTKLYSTRSDIGGAFKAGRLVSGPVYTTYLDDAYDNFTDHVQNDLKLRHVMGYYWDAMNTTRPLEGKFLSVCSAVELLAKRYSDHYNQQGSTADRIAYLVNELDVETMDLAEFAATADQAVSDEYFYSYSRQYVVHGDNNPSFAELQKDHEAAKALLQRIIRNQLIGPCHGDEYGELGTIEPQDTMSFD